MRGGYLRALFLIFSAGNIGVPLYRVRDRGGGRRSVLAYRRRPVGGASGYVNLKLHALRRVRRAVCITLGYAGDMVNARERAQAANNGVDLAIVVPKEGGILFFDVMAIPKDAPKLVCSSPGLIAAYRVLHRLLAPRHSPYALSSLTTSM